MIITLGAVLGALLIQLTGSGLIGGAKSFNDTKADLHVIEIMEQITRDYRCWISSNPGPLTDFETQIRTAYADALVTGDAGDQRVAGKVTQGQ